MEMEYGPSQVEFVFEADTGLSPADDMIMFRNAVKQVCRRHGYHATFMCRPQIPNVCSSGWHLHQSLRAADTGANLFTSVTPDQPLSPLGMHYLGGLLRDAAAAAPFSTPTINGYKRYQPLSLAPDRAIWGIDNRGVMLRVVGGPGSKAARVENRVGEPGRSARCPGRQRTFPRLVRRRLRGLSAPDQACRNCPLQCGGDGLGAAGVFRPVLTKRLVR